MKDEFIIFIYITTRTKIIDVTLPSVKFKTVIDIFYRTQILRERKLKSYFIN